MNPFPRSFGGRCLVLYVIGAPVARRTRLRLNPIRRRLIFRELGATLDALTEGVETDREHLRPGLASMLGFPRPFH